MLSTAIRHDQINARFGNPHIAQMLQLEYVLKGVKRLAKSGSHKRLPISANHAIHFIETEKSMGKSG